MFVIAYTNQTLGGYGDRIIGLISIKLISKLLNKPFYILWKKENIKKYLNYDKYDFSLIKTENNDIKYFELIDDQLELKHYLLNSKNLFPNEINIFKLNQEISQYLYKNPLFIDKDYFQDIISEYEKLYSDILVPTNFLIKKIEHLTKDKSNIVGIQLRCGDCYMKNCADWHNTNNKDNIIGKLLKIKYMVERKFKKDYNIFFTTDNIEILKILYNIFNSNKIIYNDDEIQHLDRPAINDDISKTFLDSFILSQKTEMLFISKNSNFGRIAALSSHHNEIYDTNTGDLLVKKNLLTKGDFVF